jgi:putative ABC transport system permease protein
MDTVLRDVRYAMRMLLSNPGFTAVAVLTLALAIGANTTMFSVVNATLLRPLPFPDGDRLMTLWEGSVDDASSLNISSLPNYRDWVSRNRSFETLALFDSAGRGYNLGAAATGASGGAAGGAEAERVSGLRVTASFFTVLGVKPMLGRTFLEAEEAVGQDDRVVLSYGLWKRRYGADPGIVGRTIPIDGHAYTVVGVMPEQFKFQFWSLPRELWVPVGWTKGDADRGSHSFVTIGRLRPGVTMAQASSEMDVIGRALSVAYPADNAGRTVRLVAMSDYGLRGIRPVLFVLLAVVGFVLLIACVNVANLMLARAASRQRELAIRCALGAGRGRLVRQLLTESALLACIGGAAGLAVAWVGTRALLPILPRDLSAIAGRPLERIDVDASVLIFTIGVSLVTSILFGLTPALMSVRGDLNDPLKDQARGSTGGKSRLRYGLVASEVALTLVVLAGAGVMIVSLARLLHVNPGLDTRNVLVMNLSVPQENLYYGPPGNPRFCASVAQQIGGVPGVLSASAIAHLPLGGGGAGRGLAIEGRPDPGPRNQPGAGYSVACPGILKTLGITLNAGREFTDQDTLEAPGVVLINESLAKRHWPGEDAVGKRLKIGRTSDTSPWLTVVGVFADFRHGGLDSEARPMFFRPYQQAGWPVITVVVKTNAAPKSLARSVKSAMAIMDPDLPVSTVLTMEEIVGQSVASRRFPMLLLSGFALLALVLAAVGIAGVVGYSVLQRTPEIGVRVALGAQPRDVLRLVIGHSLLWALAGVAAGLVGCVALLRFLESLLFGVTATDPIVLAAVSSVLVFVALTASYLPARRALRVDPVAALRRL